LDIAQKCTGCAHLLDAGNPLPRCVEVCPTEALRFGEREELAGLLEGAQVLKPETGLGPNVYYRNLPGQFIAGTLYDPIEEEVIKGPGAWRCPAVGFSTSTPTNSAISGLRPCRGRVRHHHHSPGFRPKYCFGVSTKECVNLGISPWSGPKKLQPPAPALPFPRSRKM
jgi:hypothetical protein